MQQNSGDPFKKIGKGQTWKVHGFLKSNNVPTRRLSFWVFGISTVGGGVAFGPAVGEGGGTEGVPPCFALHPHSAHISSM